MVRHRLTINAIALFVSPSAQLSGESEQSIRSRLAILLPFCGCERTKVRLTNSKAW
jgi:hypothetical protein